MKNNEFSEKNGELDTYGLTKWLYWAVGKTMYWLHSQSITEKRTERPKRPALVAVHVSAPPD